jgi:hypothetical protein
VDIREDKYSLELAQKVRQGSNNNNEHTKPTKTRSSLRALLVLPCPGFLTLIEDSPRPQACGTSSRVWRSLKQGGGSVNLIRPFNSCRMLSRY